MRSTVHSCRICRTMPGIGRPVHIRPLGAVDVAHWIVVLITMLVGVRSGFAQSPYSSYRVGNSSGPGHSVFTQYDSTSAPPNWGEATTTTLDAWNRPYHEPAAEWESPATTGWDRPLGSFLGLDNDRMAPLLDFQNRQGDKQLLLLEQRPANNSEPSLTLGAQFRLSAMLARTNTSSHFPYLGRFPTDFSGKTASDLRILQANQAGVLNFTPWATGYFETLFSDVFSFSSFKQGSYQVRQAYVVFGDLDVTPFYLFLGKKNISFGDMGTLSPFTQSVVWHYFAPLAEQGGIGYTANGLNLTATGINGLRGIRTVDSEEKGHINNFALNGHYTWTRDERFSWTLGAGYLHGTIYDGPTAEHLDPGVTGPLNHAWDVNGHVQWGPMHFAGEYVTTVNSWPVTAHEVTAWRTELAYDAAWVDLPLWFSLSYSEGIQGARNTEFESNRQLVAGAEWRLSPNARLTFEYVRSMGFAPLINITTVSDKSVRQNSLIFGMVLTL